MPNRVRNPGEEPKNVLPEHGVKAAEDSVGIRTRPARQTNVPRWRKIEMLKERAALRDALGDDMLDFDDIELEVFGSEQENETLYRHDEPFPEDEEDLEFDDVDDEEFDDLDDD